MKFKYQIIPFLFVFISFQGHTQFLMDMVDTTKDMGRGMVDIYKNLNHIRIGGYIQPQYQVASEPGSPSYIGGDFPKNTDSRFMLRRGRLRFDYVRYTEYNRPSLQFVFQFDGTERGVFIRDFWGRCFDTKYNLFSFTAGMFARPFGYEVNLSSQDRESPERGRMSQILMRTERDLGAMVSFEPRSKQNFLKYVKIDAGYFNGQGLTATTDFDSFKDFIGRASLRNIPVASNISLSGGISYFQGGMRQNNASLYTTEISNNTKVNKADTSHLGQHLSRHYRGADFQIKFLEKNNMQTELRAEYWYGKQPGTASTSETPAQLLNEPYYLRNFNGAYFYALQHIFNNQNQLGFKLDWYDANTKVKESEIKPENGFSSADIKYTTLGFGYIHTFNPNLKVIAWYDRVWNEKTGLTGYESDAKDNVFTMRMQFRF